MGQTSLERREFTQLKSAYSFGKEEILDFL